MDYGSVVAVYETIFSFDKYNSRLEFLNDLEKVLGTFELFSYEQVSVIKLTIDDVIIEVDLINSTYNVSHIEENHTPIPFGINSAVAGKCLKEITKSVSTLKTIKDIIAGD